MKKRNSLLMVLLLFTIVFTGCSSNNNEKDSGKTDTPVADGQPEEKKDNYLPNAQMMTKEEVEEALEYGETTLHGKDVDNSILDSLNVDKGYRYYTEVYNDSAYTDLYTTDNNAGYTYPTILEANNPELKWHNDKYYFKLVITDELVIISDIEYVEIDGTWYKKSDFYSAENHLGNKVVNEEKLKELNKK